MPMYENGSGFTFINENDKTEEQMTKEKNDAYLTALITERRGYVERLEGAKIVGDESRTKQYTALVAGVDAELARAGDTREPRNAVAK